MYETNFTSHNKQREKRRVELKRELEQASQKHKLDPSSSNHPRQAQSGVKLTSH